MKQFTKNLCFRGILTVCAVLFLVGIAQASTGHHSHHQDKVVSPFHKANADKPLHCLLNAHLHDANQDCPHKANHSKNSKSAEFRADCGSNPINSNGISFGTDLPQQTQNDEMFHHLIFHSLVPLSVEKARLFPHSIERPPQLS